MLTAYRHVQHGVGMGTQWETPPTAEETKMYSISFLQAERPLELKVKGCQGWVATCTVTRMNFIHHHVHETMIITE